MGCEPLGTAASARHADSCSKLRSRMFGRQYLKATILYRISSALLLLFAAGHTFGFRQNNPEWGADAVLGLMRSVHFDAQGFPALIGTSSARSGFSSPCFFCSRRY